MRRNPPLAKPVFFSSFLCRCSDAPGTILLEVHGPTPTRVKFHCHQSRGVWMENISFTHLTFRFLLFLFFFFSFSTLHVMPAALRAAACSLRCALASI